MKLYYFQPKGHGPYSYFVMAHDRKEAIHKIMGKMMELEREGIGDWHIPENGGFHPSDLQEARPGEVLVNDND